MVKANRETAERLLLALNLEDEPHYELHSAAPPARGAGSRGKRTGDLAREVFTAEMVQDVGEVALDRRQRKMLLSSLEQHLGEGKPYDEELKPVGCVLRVDANATADPPRRWTTPSGQKRVWYVVGHHNELNWQTMAAVKSGVERGDGVLVAIPSMGMPALAAWAKELDDIEEIRNHRSEDDAYTNMGPVTERLRSRAARGQAWARSRDLARASRHPRQIALDGIGGGRGVGSEDSEDTDQTLGAGLSLGRALRCWLYDSTLDEAAAEFYPTGTVAARRDAIAPGAALASYGLPGGVPSISADHLEGVGLDEPPPGEGEDAADGAGELREPTTAQKRHLHRVHRDLGLPAANHFARALRHAGVKV